MNAVNFNRWEAIPRSPEPKKTNTLSDFFSKIFEAIGSLFIGNAVRFRKTLPPKTVLPLPAPLPKHMLKVGKPRTDQMLKLPFPQPFHVQKFVFIDEPAAPPIQAEEKPIALTNAEKLLTGSNLIQWGLIGASFLGTPASILLPIGAVTSLGSEIATFCTLPKDASWLRIAMSIPVLSRLLINFNPWIAKLFQITSIYNLAQNSLSKIGAAWKHSVKTCAIHMFNLASGLLFAAEGERMIQLRKLPSRTRAPDDQTELTIATGYIDNGKKEFTEVADLVSETHKEYAAKWKMTQSTFVANQDVLQGKCVIPDQYDPSDNSPTFPKLPKMGDCAPYWTKIPVAMDWVRSHMSSGKDEALWLIDHDGPITNMKEDPYYWTRKWLTNPDGTKAHIAAARESAASHQNVDPKYNLNSGFLVIRNTPESLSLLQQIWDLRNTIHDASDPNCPTKGICKTQKCLHEQEVAVQMLADNPSYFDRLFRVFPQKDPETGIGMNTSNRKGCFTRKNWDFDSAYYFATDQRDTEWEPGDIMGQPNGVPPIGQEGTFNWLGRCRLNPEETKPRLQRIERMISQTIR